MDLSKLIEHSYLKPDCSEKDIAKLCQEAIEHDFKAVCVPPMYVQFCSQKLSEIDVKVVTVIGYPYGYSATASKVAEIRRAIDDGADEFDTVINIGAVKDEKWNYLRNDIDSMTRAAHLRGKIVKINLEMALLTPQEIRKVCELCIESGANFIKTSTGLFGTATVDNITFLRNCLPNEIKIKASGDIQTQAHAQALIDAGANRIGTSYGMKIIGILQNAELSNSNKETGIQFDF